MTSAPAKLREAGPARTLRRHINMLWDYVRECRPIPGPNVRVSRTGVGAVISAVSSEVTVSSGSTVQQYRLRLIRDDFLICRLWDGTNETGADVYIAKPHELRKTPWIGQSIRISYWWRNAAGTLQPATMDVTYQYEKPDFRKATYGSTEEDQVIIPMYQEQRSIIYAVEVTEDLGVIKHEGTEFQVSKLDVNVDGRAWCKVF